MLPLLLIPVILAHQTPSFVGKWVGWMIEKDMPPTALNYPETNWTFKLSADGTFTAHVENHVMSNLVENDKGTYKVAGSKVTFTGTSRYSFDDGGKKDSGTRAYNATMQYAKRALTWDEGELHMEFLREGEKPTYTPEKFKPSNPAAARLLKSVEAHYSSLKSYADEGVMTSSGEGFTAKNVKFVTRFVRPKQFRFQASYFENGKQYGSMAAWQNGSKSWLSMTDGDSPMGPEERPLANALSTPIEAGSASTLVPELLMPDQFGSSLSKEYAEADESPDAKVGGRMCSVLVLKRGHGIVLTLWIDRETKLIVQATQKGTGEKITYSPRANVLVITKGLSPWRTAVKQGPDSPKAAGF